jgi:hypothetical protein
VIARPIIRALEPDVKDGKPVPGTGRNWEDDLIQDLAGRRFEITGFHVVPPHIAGDAREVMRVRYFERLLRLSEEINVDSDPAGLQDCLDRIERLIGPDLSACEQ